ncbi:MAG: hypothetical protein ABI120_24390, partial [Gemmatimonadaceae bacterium]
VTTQSIERCINGISVTLTPFHWLSTRAAYGRDDATQIDRFYVRNGEGPVGTSRPGFAMRTRGVFVNQNTELGSTATFHLTSALTSKTTVGVQWIDSKTTSNSLAGSGWRDNPRSG